MAKRSLSVTLAMLTRENIPAKARVERDRSRPRVRVEVGDPRKTAGFRTLTFGGRDLGMAADWMVERAIRLYPRSCIAGVWRMVAQAEEMAQRIRSGATPPYEL